MIFIQNGIKRIRINLLMKREIHAATAFLHADRFFLISVEADNQLREKEQISG